MAQQSLARAQEKREMDRRARDVERAELSSYFGQNKVLDANFKIEERSDTRRREREARERQAEHEKLEGLYRDAKFRELRQTMAYEEDALTKEMERRKKETERKEREVQKIREESEELRWLQEKLRAAEMNMQRKMQLEEAKMIKERNLADEAEHDEIMEKRRLETVAAIIAAEQQKRMEQVAARRVLEEQMDEKVELQALARREYERERAAIDAVVAKIRDEDMAEAARKKHKQEETKEYIRSFLQEQEEMRTLQKAADAEEDRRIAAHAAEMERRAAVLEVAKAAKQADADAVLDKLSKEKLAQEAERERMEELINELHYQESEEKYREAQAAKEARQQKAREEMMIANEYQKQLRAARQAQEEEEERLFREKLLAKFAEDDRIEQMNANRRRMKLEEHKREVQRLWEEKKNMYEAQREAELANLEQARADEENKALIVEEERLRMLREHAARMAEFLPKGVLQKPEDLELIKQTLAEISI